MATLDQIMNRVRNGALSSVDNYIGKTIGFKNFTRYVRGPKLLLQQSGMVPEMFVVPLGVANTTNDTANGVRAGSTATMSMLVKNVNLVSDPVNDISNGARTSPATATMSIDVKNINKVLDPINDVANGARTSLSTASMSMEVKMVNIVADPVNDITNAAMTRPTALGTTMTITVEVP